MRELAILANPELFRHPLLTEAERLQRLRIYGPMPNSTISPVTWLRRATGSILVRFGHRLHGVPTAWVTPGVQALDPSR
jgi:hypothetical protein